MAGIPDRLKGRSLTRIGTWTRDELETVLDLADELKVERARRHELRVLPGRTIGLIFHKPSTRTRVGFEVGIAELGGMALYLPAADLQLSRGESYRDTALVLSRFVSAIMIRTFDQAEVETFAEFATVPVINGLTDEAHPLQALADAMTMRERFGRLDGLRLTYLGDGNNECHSLMRIAGRFGMHFTAACPPGYEPRADVVAASRADAERQGGSVTVTAEPIAACEGVDVLYTDVWTSMGQEAEREQRVRDLERFQLDGELLSLASPNAIAMHCLPAPGRGGDLGGDPVRPAIRGLGSGGEPPAHAEGRDGARHPLMRFEDVVRAALDELPPELAAGLRNVAVVVEDENAEEPDLYGLFEGISLADGEPAAGELPSRIALYRRPLEQDFPRSRPAARGDPDHRPPRARSLLRAGRGSSRRARVRVTPALEVVTWVALVAGAIVVAVYLFSRRD